MLPMERFTCREMEVWSGLKFPDLQLVKSILGLFKVVRAFWFADELTSGWLPQVAPG